jgi:hypothetical protein
MDASRLDRIAVDLRALQLALAHAQGEFRSIARNCDARADELQRCARVVRELAADVNEARDAQHAKR